MKYGDLTENRSHQGYHQIIIYWDDPDDPPSYFMLLQRCWPAGKDEEQTDQSHQHLAIIVIAIKTRQNKWIHADLIIKQGDFNQQKYSSTMLNQQTC